LGRIYKIGSELKLNTNKLTMTLKQLKLKLKVIVEMKDQKSL